MATKDGRSQIWYADGNGNVEGYTETVDNIAETIINTFNEHYGTDIEIWTPEKITLQVGNTLPNWNAYEKIEMPTPPIPIGNYLVYDIDRGLLFRIAEEGIYVYAQTNEQAYKIQTDGEVIDTLNISDQYDRLTGYINSLNDSLGTDYTKEDVQTIIIPNLIGTNIKNVVESYELVEVT